MVKIDKNMVKTNVASGAVVSIKDSAVIKIGFVNPVELRDTNTPYAEKQNPK